MRHKTDRKYDYTIIIEAYNIKHTECIKQLNCVC